MVKKQQILIIVLLALLLIGCNMNNLPEGELKNTVVSPSGKCILNMYLCDGGATTDYSVRGEVVYDNGEKRNIYWNYHCEEFEVSWIDDETVLINGIKLNIFDDEYDWRNE